MTTFLTHTELLFQPGERELAVQFFEALGCAVADLTESFGASSTYLGVFASGAEQDALNDVLYLSEFRGERSGLGTLLDSRAGADQELADQLRQNDIDRRRPGATGHFGLRFPTVAALDQVAQTLEAHLPEALTGRVTVYPSFTVPLPKLGVSVKQLFVFTDVIGPGFFPFGQLIELQAVSPLTD